MLDEIQERLENDEARAFQLFDEFEMSRTDTEADEKESNRLYADWQSAYSDLQDFLEGAW